MLGFDIYSKSGTLIDSGDQRFTATTVAKVGEATAAVLKHATQTENCHIHVSSFDLTQKTVLEALEKHSEAGFLMGKRSLVELNTSATKNFQDGKWETAYGEFVTAIVYSSTRAVHFPRHAENWNAILGIDFPESFDKTIKNLVEVARDRL